MEAESGREGGAGACAKAAATEDRSRKTRWIGRSLGERMGSLFRVQKGAASGGAVDARRVGALDGARFELLAARRNAGPLRMSCRDGSSGLDPIGLGWQRAPDRRFPLGRWSCW